jgi:cysteine synthase A
MHQQVVPYASIIESIGNTPVVELARITRGINGRILAKLEYLNPGLSKKDRIARQIIEDAEASGILKPGRTVVELTSGNTGTGLALVCAVKGYPFVAVMSKGNSVERVQMMTAFGAEVVLVDQCPNSQPGQVSGKDLELVERETQKIVEERGAFRADQFCLQGNTQAYYLRTGPEFIIQSGESIEAFCDFVGTGGSFTGCAMAFKEHDPSILCFIVEPAGTAILSGKLPINPSHRIQGGGYSKVHLPLLKAELIDGYLSVTDEEAIQMVHRLAKEEGIFAGFSSGANVAAALKLLKNSLAGKTVAVLLSDSGLKYLSTDLWE